MKINLTIARIIVGVLFIFSGLIKAIDPLGLTYKMQEFFEVWAREGYATSMMNALYAQSFNFSIIIITLEVALGVALLVGWKPKLVLRLLLLLMVFFTFLTSYVLFSGKIATCGCFGDCVPLTPIQTFTKDIILLALIIFMLLKQRYFVVKINNSSSAAVVLFSVVAVGVLQLHVIKHLPLKDCLPFKKGNDLLKLRQLPADAIPDTFAYSFIYEKNNHKKEFSTDQLPDSSWTYVDRKQTLVKKGKNNIPLINDFSLTDSTGNDATETILSQPGTYFLFFIKDMGETNTANWITEFTAVRKKAREQNRPVYLVTSDKEKANQFFNQLHQLQVPILTCDATAIKTAARANPTLFMMKGPVVQQKLSWADLSAVMN